MNPNAQAAPSSTQSIPQEISGTDLPDVTSLKLKMKATWEDGDYAHFATYMEAGAAEVLDGWDIATGSRLLDIACGSGQTAIPAAKRGVDVTGVDLAANLVDYARERAERCGVKARFDQGDAENLPYRDADFDNALSMFGAMFAPRPENVASEIARVLRSGGRLYMANWTAESMPARMFKCVASITPPPPGVTPPVLWGDEATVRQRLSPFFKDIRLNRKIYPQWHYPFSASELVDLFRDNFGPVKRAFDVCDEDERADLHDRLEAIYTSNSEIQNGVLTITRGEYLEVIATRR